MEANHVMSEFLRLRHRLVPYLYTMNYRAWKEDKPLCQPMYYVEPEDFAAYKVPNQYMFGSELMVAPVTSKRIPSVRSSKVTTWLPEGVWFDIFNGRVYEGGRTMELYRPLSQIPVLARAGAILPMTDQISAKDVESNPQQLEIRVYAGADGAFTLYEDDNVSCGYEKGDCAETPMELNWTEKTFILHPVEGNTALVPEKRSYRIRICGSTASEAVVLRGGVEQKVPVSHCEKKQELYIELADVKADETIEIRLPKDTQIKSNPVVEEVDALLTMAEIAFMQKEDLFALVEKFQGKLNLLVGELQAMELDDALRGALMEIITARQ
jgi:hypothetical protein